MESDFNNPKRLTINDFAGEHKFRLLAWEEFSVGQGVYNNLHLHFLGNCISCSAYNNRPYIQQLSVTYPELHMEASRVVAEAVDSHGAYRPNEETNTILYRAYTTLMRDFGVDNYTLFA